MKKLFILLAVFILVSGLCFAQTANVAQPPANGGEVPALPKPELFDLEVSVGFPVHWTNAEHDREFYAFYGQEYLQLDKTVTGNTSIGVSLLWNFSRKIGLTFDADFFYGGRLGGFSSSTSDSNQMFGANALLGPVFFIYNGTFLRVPLAVGVHVYYFFDELWVPYLDPTPHPTVAGDQLAGDGFWIQRQDLQFGPGIYLGVQFHFNNNIYLFSRTNVSIDVYRRNQIKWIIDEDLTAYPYPPAGTALSGNLTDEAKSEMGFAISWNVKPALGLGIKF